MATNRRLLMESQSYAESLEAKIEEIRGDPEALRDTVQRVDLMYAQIDTLIQAFAGKLQALGVPLVSTIHHSSCYKQQKVENAGRQYFCMHPQRTRAFVLDRDNPQSPVCNTFSSVFTKSPLTCFVPQDPVCDWGFHRSVQFCGNKGGG